MYKDLEELREIICVDLTKQHDCKIRFYATVGKERREIALNFHFTKSNENQYFSENEREQITKRIAKLFSREQILPYRVSVDRQEAETDNVENKPKRRFIASIEISDWGNLPYSKIIPFVWYILYSGGGSRFFDAVLKDLVHWNYIDENRLIEDYKRSKFFLQTVGNLEEILTIEVKEGRYES